MLANGTTAALAGWISVGLIPQAVAERVDSDVAELWTAERNHDPVPWLRARGWTVQADSVADLSESYGRAIRPADRDLFRAGLLITATRD